MHHLPICSVLLLFITGLESNVTFTSPQEGDVWTVGQTQFISWTKVTPADNPNNDYLSVQLYQLFNNRTNTLNFEYIIQNAVSDTVNANPAGWTVALDTTKGLNSDISNSYILALYLAGDINILAQSQAFTINNTTSPSSSISSIQTTSSTASSSNASSSSTSSTPLSSTGSTTSTLPSSATTIPPSPAATSNVAPVELTTGVKAGVGIGVSAAVLLGLLLGWFLFGRHKRQNSDVPTTVYDPSFSKPVNWQESASVLNGYTTASQTPHMIDKSGTVPIQYSELPAYTGR